MMIYTRTVFIETTLSFITIVNIQDINYIEEISYFKIYIYYILKSIFTLLTEVYHWILKTCLMQITLMVKCSS